MQVARDKRTLRLGPLAAAVALVCLAPVCVHAEKTVNVFSSGKTVQAIFQGLAGSADVEIALDPDVTGTVDLSLKDFPFTSAMNAVCSAAGLEWEKGSAAAGKEVYLVHRGRKKVVIAEDASTTGEPAKTKIDFRSPAERALAEEAATNAQNTDTADTEDPAKKFKNVRELHLNAAQLRLVLGGVPPMKANSVLNQCRQQNAMNGPRMYQPGVNGYNQSGNISGPGFGYAPYYHDARMNRVGYNPDGSVWVSRPARQRHTQRSHPRGVVIR